ncbi:MAG TPA: PEP-CTERM sorting domain-containing protein [Stellaceae bacterium]|jgi:hypothetical protein|nr:PEP-CTERM sorting domain-containing protein [Stellaceae bacterium]
MSVRLSQIVRLAVMTAGIALVTAPAFAWYSGGGGGCTWGCGGGGTPVPEPSTLALLGVAIPGAAAWIKHKLF